MGSASAQVWAAPLCIIDAPLSFLAPIAITEAIEEVDDDECEQFLSPFTGEAISTLEAQCGLNRARTLHAEGDTAGALAYLSGLIDALPPIADRLELMRGSWALEMNDHVGATRAFQRALQSPDSTTRVLGEIGQVRALAITNPARATRDLNRLVRRYPRLPQQRNIQLEIAEHYESMDQLRRAIAGYRAIDRQGPGSAAATQARAHLMRLREAGHAVGGYSAEQLVSRAERWMRTGPLEGARGAIEAIRTSEVRLSADQRARLSLMRARIARIEGRFADASTLLNAGHSSSTLDGEESQRIRNRARDMAAAAQTPNAARARTQIRRVQRGRAYIALRPPQLLRILDIAVRGGLTAEVNRVLTVLPRKEVSGNTLFDAAIGAIGVAEEEQILTLLSRAQQSGRLDARYHYARMLEERGAISEASQRYRSIMSADRSTERYYAMWSTLRLSSIEARAELERADVPQDSASEATAGQPAESSSINPAFMLTLAPANLSVTEPHGSEGQGDTVEAITTDAVALPQAPPEPVSGEGRQSHDDDADLPALALPDTAELALQLTPPGRSSR